MAIYAIGDLHLSTVTGKKMDIFPGWENYTDRICGNWKNKVKCGDTVVLAGDICWAMNLEEAVPDFSLLQELPGTKIILKGNHDYWWSSAAKMNAFFERRGFTSLRILHNNSYEVERVNLCGSRGWLFENGLPHDDKIINREAIRIEASLASVKNRDMETILFLHYPPLFGLQVLEQFIGVMTKFGIKKCYYGHIHGAGRRSAIQGRHYGIDFQMISADYLAFDPILIKG